MNKLFTLLALLITTQAFAVIPEKHPTDQFQIGKSSTSNDKQLIYDLGLGASNPAVSVDTSENLKYNYNSFLMGDGTNTQKTLTANIGSGVSNPNIIWNQSLNQWQFSTNGSNYQSLGSGSGGNKNYLSVYTASTASGVPNTGNGNFEFGSTTGFSLGTIGTLTNGLPTGSPTFGAGASGNLSISVVTGSSAIAGNYSLSYASSAATTVGNMLASSAFFIDSQDQAKVLTTQFYYKINSGAANGNYSGTSSNSFAWAAYDVTNSSWLTSAGNFCMVQNSGQGYCTGTVQTNATTTQLRFVFYNANATTGATTLYLDSISMGPQTAPSGPAMSDLSLTPYTITPNSGAFGTITNNNLATARRGKMLQIQGSFTSGTVAGGTAYLTIPLSIDYSAIGSTNYTVIGTWVAPVGSSASNLFTSGATGVAFVDGSTSNQIFLGFQSASGEIVKGTGSGAGGVGSSNQPFILKAELPIAGWSSNSVQSSDTDTRVLAASVGNTAGGTVAANSASQLTYDSVNFDQSGSWSTSTNSYTVPVSGFYNIEAHSSIVATLTSGTTQLQLFVYKNGSSYAEIAQNGGAGSAINAGYRLSGSTIIKCNAGDTLSIYAEVQGAGASSGTVSGGSAFNYLNINRLSGPAVIAATESVNGRYAGSSSSISSSYGTIVYNTKSWDSHNAYNNSTGTWTCPVSGRYLFNAALTTTASAIPASGYSTIKLVQSGSASQTSEKYAPGVLNNFSDPSVSDTFYCLAGDSIIVQASSVSTTSPTIQNSTTRDYISWQRVGN